MRKSSGLSQSKSLTGTSSKSKTQINLDGMSKANLTLWKSKYAQPTNDEELKKVENDYIENLKQQVYFMEMELKLLKEREKEIEKSGGFTQLFNDERDPTQHIMQLKSKYSNMRKNMEDKIEELNNKKREVTSVNVSLKSKYDTLKKIEKEIYDKVVNLDERLENEYMKVNKERLDVETNNRLDELNLRNELQDHQALEFNLLRDEKIESCKLEDFQAQQYFIESAIKNKIKEFEALIDAISELETKAQEEPIYKIELEKNLKNKKKIELLEEEMMKLNTEIEELEQVNEYLVSKKDRIIQERKKLAQLNEDLKREIESKNQLNEARIQKKVKDNNSDEIQKLETHSNSILNNIRDYEQKLDIETSKSREFSIDIMKLNIELRDKNEQRQHIIEVVDQKLKELEEYKADLDELSSKQKEIKEKLNKEMNESMQFKARNKILSEEYAATMSKYNYIIQNYDFTSNLKKISMEDLKTLTQTNNLVNDTIGNFVNKIGSFKKQNVRSMFDDNF